MLLTSIIKTLGQLHELTTKYMTARYHFLSNLLQWTSQRCNSHHHKHFHIKAPFTLESFFRKKKTFRCVRSTFESLSLSKVTILWKSLSKVINFRKWTVHTWKFLLKVDFRKRLAKETFQCERGLRVDFQQFLITLHRQILPKISAKGEHA